MVTACAKEIRIRATRRNLEENLGTEGKWGRGLGRATRTVRSSAVPYSWLEVTAVQGNLADIELPPWS